MEMLIQIYERKSLNNRNFILKCMKSMHNEKSYFGTQNGSLAVCHIGVVMIEQYELAQLLVQHGRSTVNLHHGGARSIIRFLW